MWLFIYVLSWIYSFYRLELENEVNPERRRWLARRLLEVKQGYLNEQRQERERMERENRNLEEALDKVRAIKALRSQKRK